MLEPCIKVSAGFCFRLNKIVLESSIKVILRLNKEVHIQFIVEVSKFLFVCYNIYLKNFFFNRREFYRVYT